VAQPILPFAQSLLLCDGYAPAGDRKFNFYGSYYTIRVGSYPHTQARMCVVAHLSGGMGTMTTFVDVRSARTEELVFTTVPRQLTIPNRDLPVRLVNVLERLTFPEPGVYFVELYCENTPIADFRLQLEARDDGWTGAADGKAG
jgi:hypothetical protein